MFVPKNVIPHLKWLTDADYPHVNYVDIKPYIFDAKIFAPDSDHPGGWGTILVGGLGFGGGDIGVDTDSDTTNGDELTLRSEYFILDITNPEKPPKILGEFKDPNLGFTIGAPTAIPMLLCNLNMDCPSDQSTEPWPMDWYLAFPSGPHDTTSTPAATDAVGPGRLQQSVGQAVYGTTGRYRRERPSGECYPSGRLHLHHLYAGSDAGFENSFFTDVIAVDYDLDFKTDTLYFGSVDNADTDTTSGNTGGMHRLVLGEDADSVSNPWSLNTFFKTPVNQPVSGAPSVSSDGARVWVYFGTGRYYSAKLDKINHTQQSYYGIKEKYASNGHMDLTAPTTVKLVDVSKVWVADGGDLNLTTGSLPLKAIDSYNGNAETELTGISTFNELNAEMSAKTGDYDTYNGWKLDFDLTGERNLGQAAVLGNIVTFTTFVPSENICQPEGESYLWAPYFRTGTAYARNVIGTVNRDGTTEIERKIDIGGGLASTPNIHSGAETGSTAFVQTSTGAIISVQQDNPGVVKSGVVSWRELGD